MRFDPDHAEDVALPSACLLVADLFPHLTGEGRDQLIRRVTDFLMTTLSAFCEFHPPDVVSQPSRN